MEGEVFSESDDDCESVHGGEDVSSSDAVVCWPQPHQQGREHEHADEYLHEYGSDRREEDNGDGPVDISVLAREESVAASAQDQRSSRSNPAERLQTKQNGEDGGQEESSEAEDDLRNEPCPQGGGKGMLQQH